MINNGNNCTTIGIDYSTKNIALFDIQSTKKMYLEVKDNRSSQAYFHGIKKQLVKFINSLPAYESVNIFMEVPVSVNKDVFMRLAQNRAIILTIIDLSTMGKFKQVNYYNIYSVQIEKQLKLLEKINMIYNANLRFHCINHTNIDIKDLKYASLPALKVYAKNYKVKGKSIPTRNEAHKEAYNWFITNKRDFLRFNDEELKIEHLVDAACIAWAGTKLKIGKKV